MPIEKKMRVIDDSGVFEMTVEGKKVKQFKRIRDTVVEVDKDGKIP